MNSPRFASAWATAAGWEDALHAVIAELPRLPQANLGFLYVSDHFAFAIDTILGQLRAQTGVLEWVGATGVGVIGTQGAALDAPGISVMLGAFPLDSFRVFSGRRPLPRDFAPYAALVHADPLTPDMSELVQDMALKVRGGRIAGGLASARQQAFHIAGEALTGGLSGVAFNEHIQTLTGVSQGCAPLPGSWRVTQAQDSLIERINGRPAVEVFREAAGTLGTDLRRAVSTLLVGLTDADDDRRQFAARRIVALDVRSGRIAITESIAKGQNIVFLKRDEETARSELAHMLAELKAACPHPPKGGIYVNCASRGGVMFERDDSELEMIREVFGPIPLAGFFAAGEIAGDHLFGQTGTLTLFL
ncbi:FIST N-terminal domain-containing protein [Uliginosibacterium flavum]|uniref:FIST N-terminal domain-containing protein n=1 Tax=Uliginosibacterium flavum TaxID=1396831 RepID=A0ABV2TMW6_9RHOO